MVQESTGGATHQNCPRFKGDRLPTVSDSEAGAMGGRRGVFRTGAPPPSHPAPYR